MNLDQTTRKTQILRYLQDRQGEWVDGTELATESVGGSEGLRRLRDLRSDGYAIQQRKHPDPKRDIWQYRLITQAEVTPLRASHIEYIAAPRKLVFGLNTLCDHCNATGKKHGQDCPYCEGKGWI